MALIGKEWDRWDVIFLSLLGISIIWKVAEIRMKANILYGRFILDFVTGVNGELILWETASPIMQTTLGVFNFFSTFFFAVLMTCVMIIVMKLFKLAGVKRVKQ